MAFPKPVVVVCFGHLDDDAFVIIWESVFHCSLTKLSGIRCAG